MLIHHIAAGILVPDGKIYRLVKGYDWDRVFTADNPADELAALAKEGADVPLLPPLLPPVKTQEVWAAGVTYLRSKSARMAESKDAGGGTFYDRVYDAPRPELFMKATGPRVRGHNQRVRIRSDSKWNVPEPELTLAVNTSGTIIGYTIGNDMSSRDIEGENPLYLPQAKIYAGSCALGPGLLLQREPLDTGTPIQIRIVREGATVFEGQTTLASLKRKPQELVDYLYRDNWFPKGALLMTGTGIIPPDSFTLAGGDEISITIPPIGTLTNKVE
jgi:2-dehydro-3-deoxy-D-arabinonate dehydratase